MSPARSRSAISQVVSGHITPTQDCKTTTPIAAKCANRNHGLRTQIQSKGFPINISAKPRTTNATKNTCPKRSKSAAKRYKKPESICDTQSTNLILRRNATNKRPLESARNAGCGDCVVVLSRLSAYRHYPSHTRRATCRTRPWKELSSN